MAWTTLDFTAFQTLTATQMDQMYANMAGLKDGTLFDVGAIGSTDLSTSAIKLGHAEITTTFTGAGNTNPQQVTGLTASVTIPAGGRGVKITGFVQDVGTNTGGATVLLSIWDGTVGSGTRLAAARNTCPAAAALHAISVQAFITPSAGAKTYNIGLQTDNAANTAFIEASATAPAFILVELI